jgi:hypothetical protein
MGKAVFGTGNFLSYLLETFRQAQFGECLMQLTGNTPQTLVSFFLGQRS